MVKYFDELDNPESFNVYMTHNNRFNRGNNLISPSFYAKYYKIFEYINAVNNIDEVMLLKETCSIPDLKEKYLRQIKIVELISKKYHADINKLYNLLVNKRYENAIRLLSKVDILGSRDFTDILVLYYYLVDAINPFNDKSILSVFKEALKELNESDNKAIYGREVDIITLPKYWYILPDFHELDGRLYNTTGINGHKEANLLYPYCRALNGTLLNSREFIDKVKDIEEHGASLNDYMYYVGYGVDSLPNPIENNDEKIFMKSNVKVTTGSVMAQGLLWEYFTNLNHRTTDYGEALNVFNKVILDDFLIRFLGFHKVVLKDNKKIISTSNLDYEKEFIEYEERGWHIDFTMPLQFNCMKNKIEEVDDNFVKLKQFHENF